MLNRVRIAGMAVVMVVAFAPVLPGPVRGADGSAEKTTFAVIGDWGLPGPDFKNVAKMIDTWDVDFIATVGDNSYPFSTKNNLKMAMRPYEKWLDKDWDKNRFWPAMGNHDYVPGMGHKDYRKIYNFLGEKVYYTVRKGPVQLFVLDSHKRHAENRQPWDDYFQDQKEWFKKEAAKSDAPWKVVLFHHPPFSAANHGPNPRMQWPFKEWGADVVLAGHEHVYQRVDGMGYPLLINGVGGNPKFYGCCDNPVPEGGSLQCFTKHFGAQKIEADEKTMTISMISLSWPDQPVDVCTFKKGEGMTCEKQAPAPKGLTWETCEKK